MLSSQAFAGYTRGRGLNNSLNYGPFPACELPDLTIALALPAEGTNNNMYGSLRVLKRFMVL